jgi:hypothetical protein
MLPPSHHFPQERLEQTRPLLGHRKFPLSFGSGVRSLLLALRLAFLPVFRPERVVMLAAEPGQSD